MDKIYEKSLLYDFYGELLTDHQKQVYEDVVLNDFSLSEVADEIGISRQGVHDLVARATKSLEEYEKRLGNVKKFLEIRKKAERIKDLTDDAAILAAVDEILEEL